MIPSRTVHEAVLLQEVIHGLGPVAGDIVFDGTTGGGGHSEAIALLIGYTGSLICCDLSQTALDIARERLDAIGDDRPQLYFAQGNFRQIKEILSNAKIEAVHKILYDLGLSSDELERSGRGFSFKHPEEPLLMTFADSPKEDDVTAKLILNTWSESTIADILFGFGGERRARTIAKAVVHARTIKPFETVGDLVTLIESLQHGKKKGPIHPATRTFQALRMAVNAETDSLEEGIRDGVAALAPKGRIAIISFESVTDRIVKRAFLALAKEEKGTVITKKPIIGTDEEVARNPRARSAKLRIFEKF